MQRPSESSFARNRVALHRQKRAFPWGIVALTAIGLAAGGAYFLIQKNHRSELELEQEKLANSDEAIQRKADARKAHALNYFHERKLKYENCDKCQGSGTRTVDSVDATTRVVTRLKVQCGACSGGVRLADQSDKRECQRCSGTGLRHAWDKAKCRSCDGLGKRHRQKKYIGDPGYDFCSTCRGTGEQTFNLTAESDCPDCHGKGYHSLSESLESSPYYKDCPDCQEGELYGGAKCSRCRGIGMLPRSNDQIEKQPKVCEACRGKGVLDTPNSKSAECKMCGGRGHIED